MTLNFEKVQKFINDNKGKNIDFNLDDNKLYIKCEGKDFEFNYKYYNKNFLQF